MRSVEQSQPPSRLVVGEGGENNFELFDFAIVFSRADATNMPGSDKADSIVWFHSIICGLLIDTFFNFTFKVLKGRIDNAPKLFKLIRSRLSLV